MAYLFQLGVDIVMCLKSCNVVDCKAHSLFATLDYTPYPMTQLTVFKLINIILLIFNALVFFAPKKPMNNLTSNGAGILALIALVIIAVYVVHFILTGVAFYFNSVTLFKVIAFLMIPASAVFWYYAFQMIHFNRLR